MNKIFLIGNLTKDPESKTTANGVQYCRFSIAVNRKYANADGNKTADFFNIVAWRGLAETAQKYLSKGMKVCVDGYVTMNNYEDSKGNTRLQVDINADNIEFLTKKEEKDTPYSGMAKKPVQEGDFDDNDLPF